MKKILIVDDQKEVRELVKVTLRVGDYEIFTAENGEQAVDVARQEKPDLVIMDVMMPGAYDGFEAARIIKNSPESREAIVIMLTARGQQTDIDRGREVGADDYFVKPFSPLDLIQKVDEVLDNEE